MFPFDPPESRKPLVSCFQGDQKGTMERKELIISGENFLVTGDVNPLTFGVH